MKFRRSERLVDMTHYLMNHPRKLVSLTYFSQKYLSAKSSISEDLVIIKETFENQGIGTLQTLPGAAGGVKYIPKVKKEQAEEFANQLCASIADSERLLPGGYLFMTDLLGDSQVLNEVGKHLASAFSDRDIDVIMTVATKGIPIAQAVAHHLNVPFVVVRRDSLVTEGSTVSINYVSGSSKRLQTMSLSKRSLKEGAKVLIVDDFMKAGGTVNGMVNLLAEFNASVAGIAVLVESEFQEERLVEDYVSLIKLSDVDVKGKKINVVKGNFFFGKTEFL
ncbi:pur operon repressor [Lederbergia lenta]|uniref:Purine operon repressor PurR n=1 Tax=Lederbergia lenta TaxID=1467 RepID=A0A2X4VTG1_LEDLE|nr:pur operon repressor [Lederbergia lenta]MCM3113556.1 pur operon repressor [Lederbergia lenta]MEC2323825.1 pur operon repressor [Lederbergia lenta]SQI51128.1 purine operon repressor PurR [Lederbergia lenta]